MDFELGTLGKTVTASFATKGFFVRVSAQMLEEMPFEGSLTNGTLEGFHAAVIAAQMFAQSVRSCKSFATNWTRVISLTGVSSQMHLKTFGISHYSKLLQSVSDIWTELTLRLVEQVNLWSHWSHWYGRSPVCVRSCCSSCPPLRRIDLR